MGNEELLIGSHVSMNGPKFYLGSVEEALSYGANVFMFYTGAPQNSFRKPLNELKISEGRDLIKENNIDETKIIVHAPYIVNAANPQNADLREISIKTLISELKRAAGFGCQTMVLHPGNHLGAGVEEAIDTLADSLNKIFENDGTNVTIALETMSGKGTEIGKNFQEIHQIISKCKYPERLGVCLDTCHISDAGYDLNDFDTVLKEFDDVIGINKLRVIHLNDSKNPKESHKDRHENLGYGFIGFEILNKIAHHPLLVNIPKILETPYFNEQAPYKKEIEMLRSQIYEDNWRK